MKGFKNLSIRQKFIVLSVITCCSALLIVRTGFLIYDTVGFRQSLVRNLLTQADIVGTNSASAILFEDAASATKTMSALKAKANILMAAIYAKDGKLLSTWHRNEGDGLTAPATYDISKDKSNFGKNALEVYHPIFFDGATIGAVYIRSDLGEVRDRLSRYGTITVIIMFFSFVVVVLIATKVAEHITHPILDLTRVAKDVSENKNYSVRAVSHGSDEVGFLVRTFNEMLTQIQINQAELHRSHEELEERVEERTAQIKSANEEARNLNKFLDSIIENMPNMVFVKDAEELRFVRFNKAGEELLGYPKTSFVGKNDYDFFPKPEADFFTEKDKEVLEHRTLLDIPEEPIQTKEKGMRLLHTRKIPILDEAGNPLYLLGISEDITERRHAEDAIKNLNDELKSKATLLEAANKELEAFCYSVSHDLRAPLRSINGFSKALAEDHAEQLGAQGQADLNRIRAASERMGQLIDDMLNLSRITLSPMNREAVDLSAIARAVIGELRKANPGRTLSVEIQDGMIAQGDARLIRIALENLLENAWKYTSKQPDATIFFGLVPGMEKPTYVVRDNGAGFDMTYASKLFGAFQRLHTEAEFSGTGVGLATVRRVVSRHQGKIWAESSVNKGASFYFTLS